MDEETLAEILRETEGEQPIDYDKLWQGMPEFENKPEAIRTIHIHFQAESDVENFANLIQQQITENTRYIWFPQKEKRDLESLRYNES